MQIDWEKVEQRTFEVPFVPATAGETDVSNIDAEFTREIVAETPQDHYLMQKEKFEDFTYTEKSNLLP